jgi:uncharacterized surface protein with fasciclin (FAS1) repeats
VTRKIDASSQWSPADISSHRTGTNEPNRQRSASRLAVQPQTNMKSLSLTIAATIVAAAIVCAVENPMVGGAPMYANKNIIQNAMNSKDHTTLVAAVKAAGLVDTLQGKGPFTVFAPTNEAFEKLPAGTVDMLLKPENKQKLARILTYHVVAGKWTVETLIDKIKADGGSASIKTVNGETLTAKLENGGVQLTDAKGGTAMVTIADVMQSNGIIFVIDTVLMP